MSEAHIRPPRERIAPENLRIDRERTVADLKTVAECDAALTSIRIDVAMLADQIEDGRRAPDADAEWLRRASVALRLKKAAIAAVTGRRDALARQERAERAICGDALLVKKFLHRFPREFHICLDELKAAERAGAA